MESTKKIKVGDVVFLKSGGPALTVTDLGLLAEDTDVIVCWFNGVAYARVTLPQGALTKVNPNSCTPTHNNP